MQDLIGYDEIIENSMRSVIFETLKKVEKTGLPGKHYFIATFLVRFPGVVMPKSLLEKYPEEMTIAIQYQYKNLVVDQDNFKISLSFSGKYEKLTIPYKAVTSFTDPSMNFGLKFSVNYDDLVDEEIDENLSPANKSESKKKEIDLSAKIVSLDAFRKNKDQDN
ncbi:MAG: hypothetical protein FJ368_00760 [Pelagibacterales bacterium]|nr:hypothetical protein [Pelagibacterales bacterium]